MSSNNNNVHLGMKLTISVFVASSSMALSLFWDHGLPVVRVSRQLNFCKVIRSGPCQAPSLEGQCISLCLAPC
jgi:hypothetical protein